jgi:hypothetical protein
MSQLPVPSVEQQLKEANVRPGSALEKLIRDNQDFSLLQPEELHDDVDLPLWLRVYWRKNHPDEQHSTLNPGAGYPDALDDIYDWMVSHQDLPSSSPTEPRHKKGGRP